VFVIKCFPVHWNCVKNATQTPPNETKLNDTINCFSICLNHSGELKLGINLVHRLVLIFVEIV